MRKPPPAALVTVLALAGCGGGDNGGDGGQKGDSVTVGHNQPIAFGATEYAFTPKTVTVNAGTSKPSLVRFVLRNNGSLAHDLHVEKDGQDLGGTPIFAPGNSASGQATLGPGTYQFICTVGDHAALGMKGTLVVTTKKTTRPADPDAGGGEKDAGGDSGEP
jgi:plastocyanin